MVCQPLRFALLIGAITAVAVSPARANHRAPDCCNPCGSSSATAPAYRTITCTEWVKESYQVKRTAYKMECRTETYDTCRTECVPECRERVVCCVKKVPCMKEEIRKVCKKVTVYEDRQVMKTCYKTVQECCMKKQLVRLGHWECKEVPALFSGFGGHGCNSCCDPCATCCKTRTVKHWVHCPEYRECPVTVCKKVCYQECVTCKVPVCRTEWCEQKVQVCTYTCVTEKRVEKCTVYVKKSVPCKATRTVRVCVPYEECVTCCKMVPRTVTRQVADCGSTCSSGCGNGCGSTCGSTCSTGCCEREGLFARLKHRCNSDCNRCSTCTTSCCH